MKHVKDLKGMVHYRNPVRCDRTLCGDKTYETEELLGGMTEFIHYRETDALVNCVDCAAVVNAIRNEPFNTLFGGIDESVRMEGIYASVKENCHE